MIAKAPGASPEGRSAKPRLTFIDIECEGQVHRIAVKRVATARRFTLRVRNARGDVVLTLPPHGSAAAARAFAIRHAGWISEKLGALEPGIAFTPGAAVPFRGRVHTIEHRPGLRRRAWIEGDEPPVLCVSGLLAAVSETVATFFRHEARSDLAEATHRHALSVGRPVRGLTLRDTRSRWGSCTARGTLNFSWRLVLAPPHVLDYLAAHEVCHLVHMNHGAAFWALLERLAPRTAEAERWLKQNGARLHLYGVSHRADEAAQPASQHPGAPRPATPRARSFVA